MAGMPQSKWRYAEVRVADRVMHRFPCATYEMAERCARAFIVDMFPEDENISRTWDFYASAYWNVNDLGDGVMINAVTYNCKQTVGTYLMQPTS
jgi:hypothetical protein